MWLLFSIFLNNWFKKKNQALLLNTEYCIFQIKRPQAKAYFAKEIADMYAQLPSSEAI